MGFAPEPLSKFATLYCACSMSTRIPPLAEITTRATSALIREIGVVDTLRFLSQFRVGTGNYTLDREAQYAGMTVKNLVEDIKARRKSS